MVLFHLIRLMLPQVNFCMSTLYPVWLFYVIKSRDKHNNHSFNDRERWGGWVHTYNRIQDKTRQASKQVIEMGIWKLTSDFVFGFCIRVPSLPHQPMQSERRWPWLNDKREGQGPTTNIMRKKQHYYYCNGAGISPRPLSWKYHKLGPPKKHAQVHLQPLHHPLFIITTGTG